MAIINQVVAGSGGGSVPACYRAFEKDASGKLVNSTTTPFIPLPAGTTNLSDYILNSAYSGTPSNILSGTIDLSSLTVVDGCWSCRKMFQNCTGITSVDLSSLTEAGSERTFSEMFLNDAGITSISISSLQKISGDTACFSMFKNCMGITNVDLSSLVSITNRYGAEQMFMGCTELVNIKLDSLSKINGSSCMASIFNGCVNLPVLSFPSLKTVSSTNAFSNMLGGVTGCTVHFPSNIQATIGSWPDVTNGFGGINTTVLFDLPATNTLTGADTVTYTRNPKYDTATALAWKVGTYGTTNFTPAYYTSGTTDPSAADTIYSDAACTTSVTTIAAIA